VKFEVGERVFWKAAYETQLMSPRSMDGPYTVTTPPPGTPRWMLECMVWLEEDFYGNRRTIGRYANHFISICINCYKPKADHADNGKCLFEPTYWRSH
jgi:hypothetical protein